jgi:hypothetical protein
MNILKFVAKSVLCLGVALTGVSNASIIYSNGPAAADSFRCAETSGNCSGTWTLFDDFTLSSAQTITGIKFTSVIHSGLSDLKGARAWIYSADPALGGGSLLASIAFQSGAPVANALGQNFFDLTLSGLNINLAAGNYWLGLQNDTTAGYGTIARTANCVHGCATQWQNGGAGVHQAQSIGLAFSLEGNNQVPEPTTIALLGLGMFGFAAARRRKQ